MNNTEKDVAVKVARNMAIFIGVKVAILYGITRAMRKAVES